MACLQFNVYSCNIKNECHKSLDYKYNLFEISEYLHKKNIKTYLIKNQSDVLKICQLLNTKHNLKDNKIITVAANVSELDLTTTNVSNNFEYDDNEWDVGIGNLINNLDADIEKTRNDKSNINDDMASTPSTSSLNLIQNLENFDSANNDVLTYSNSGQQLSSSSTSILHTAIKPACHTLNNVTSAVNISARDFTNDEILNSNNNSELNCDSKMTIEHSAIVDKGLKMKIKRTKSGTKSSDAKHEIVKANESNESTLLHINDDGSNPLSIINSRKTSISHRREKGRDKHEKLQINHSFSAVKSDNNCSHKQVTHHHSSSTSPVALNSQITPSIPLLDVSSNNHNDCPDKTMSTSSTSCTLSSTMKNTGVEHKQITLLNTNSPNELTDSVSTFVPNVTPSKCFNTTAEKAKLSTVIESSFSVNKGNQSKCTVSPPTKKQKCSEEDDSKETSNICVGTSIGTITEPDCLGPCEPGTSVTLEGIVWHETEGGVLVVNVTWRGKTYVGTLLDCTRYDWAPPRFCDSPTSDLDIRTQKGRTKRGRHSVTNSDLSNFTETRSSVHSKLRNNVMKGKRTVQGSNNSQDSNFFPPRFDSMTKRKVKISEDDEKNKQKIISQNLAISPPASPILLECPEPNCSKKYKHVNGLKYHQSHAHGLTDEEETKLITNISENDESNTEVPNSFISVNSSFDETEAISTSSPTNFDTSKVDSSSPSSTIIPHSEVECNVVDTDNSKEIISKSQNNSYAVLSEAQSLSEQTTKSNINLKSSTFGSKCDSSSCSPISSSSFLYNNVDVTQNMCYSSSKILLKKENQLKDSIIQSDVISSIHKTIIQEQLQKTKPSDCREEEHFHDIKKESQEHSSIAHNISSQQSDQLVHFSKEHDIMQELSPSCKTTTDSVNKSEVVTLDDCQHNVRTISNVKSNDKMPQFKVKPTAVLMPEQNLENNEDENLNALQGKKQFQKSTNSSLGSPLETVIIDSRRDEIQSPAYSDISDDATPIIETDNCDKLTKQNVDKDIKSNQTSNFHVYPYYSQPPYVTQKNQDKLIHGLKMKEVTSSPESKILNLMPIPTLTNLQNFDFNKEKNELEPLHSSPSPSSQIHYYTNFSPYISSEYQFQPQTGNIQISNQISESNFHDEKCQMKQSDVQNVGDKQLNTQVTQKESGGIKTQVNSYDQHQSSEVQRPLSTANATGDAERYYSFTEELKCKEESHKTSVLQKSSLINLKKQSKQSKIQDTKSDDNKSNQEGVKPTMETQGPPPPPTSQYAYIHTGYIPPHHYGSISYESAPPGIYRNLTPMIVPGSFTSNPFLHQLPRYTSDELARSSDGKALDLLQHHANQYYSTHKIHELQDLTLKSQKNPNTTINSALSMSPASMRPSNASSNNTTESCMSSQFNTLNMKQSNQGTNVQQSTSEEISGTKDKSSPPPLRHVHTHHHTHVGLGYPILSGQYPTSYGAAVLASQQAAAVAASVISPYSSK